MGPENGMNPSKVNYFSMEDYVKRIKLLPYLLEHMEETNQEFDKYLKLLLKYDDYAIVYYWIDSLSKEMASSQKIEHLKMTFPLEIEQNDIFFDTLQLSHNRIKQIHQFVTNNKDEFDYRTKDVRVSSMGLNGENIFFWGACAESVKQFMNDFMKIYRSTSLSVINTNPFLKSALIHLLFVRIHPFIDGNGRTARMLHNIKFTELINKAYGMNLKISPLNLSCSILMNQPTYAKRQDDIYFDLEHDSNDEINKWFDFILNMVDEQLFFSMNRIDKLDNAFINLSRMKSTDNSGLQNTIKKMRIKTC